MPKKIEITFWGVRGSTASPGPDTAKYGGNTPCVEIKSGKSIIICDAGTGIRALGRDLVRRKKTEATILLSHLHLDHVMGLPFFKPLYKKGSRLTIASPGRTSAGLKSSLKKLLSPPYFPVNILKTQANVRFGKFSKGRIKIGPVKVETFQCNHPDGSYALKFILPDKKTVVYASDNEPSVRKGMAFIRWLKGADILIHDAQYTPEQYKGKIGWGHSPVNYPIMLAAAAGVGRLFLFHYDPWAADRNLDRIGKEALKFVRRMGLDVKVKLSRELTKISI